MSETLSNLLFSVNVVLPLVLTTALGYVLRRIGMLSGEFVSIATRFAFSVAFPCSIYRSLAGQTLGEALNVKLVIFCVVAITLSIILPMLIVPRFVRDRTIAAAMVQAMFRANFLIQGASLLETMYGPGSYASCTVLLPFIIALNNILATVVFVILVPEGSSQKNPVRQAAVKLLKNPLIIGCAVGLLFCSQGWKFPDALESTIQSVGSTATPIALIALGADFRFGDVREYLRFTLPTVLVRLIVIPGLVVPTAVLFGFRGVELSGIFLFTGACCAVSSYIMSKNMGGHEGVAAQSVGLSTVLSAFTIMLGIFILRSLGLA